jgi:hypothetical protein
MKRYLAVIAFSTLLCSAAKPPEASFAKVFDGDLTSAEKEIVSLAEAMPEDKYNFAPTGGEFTGVRTFALQMRHIGTVNNAIASAILGRKNAHRIRPGRKRA